MRRRSLGSVFVAVIVVATSVGNGVAGARRLGEGNVSGSDIEVQARDDWFLPFIASVPRGGTVVWTFTGAERSHTATDSSGMTLFDSWSSWLDGVAIAKATFEPESEGRFRFRARLRGSAGGQTGWSPRATLLAT